MLEMNNIQDYAVCTEHYMDNIQNLCRLIYVNFVGNFHPLCTMFSLWLIPMTHIGNVGTSHGFFTLSSDNSY